MEQDGFELIVCWTEKNQSYKIRMRVFSIQDGFELIVCWTEKNQSYKIRMRVFSIQEPQYKGHGTCIYT